MKKIKNITGKRKILVSDLLREHAAIKGPVEKAARRVFDSGRYILGKEVEAFEKEFARYNGSRYAIGVASGTEALEISLKALSIGPGDEVITAVNTAIPTAMAIAAAGARPKFVDVDERTSNIDIDKIEKAITGKTRAIIPVHIYGNPCNIAWVKLIAKKHKLFIVEDACQAHGASCKQKKVGSFGDLGAFSFYPTKNLGCYGDGGMIVTDNKALARKAKLLRNYGQPMRYKCDIEGINSRLDELQAAILRVKLGRLDSSNDRRRAIAALYDKNLKNIEGVTVPCVCKYARHVFHLYVIRCKNRDDLKIFLSEKGIETEIHYPIPLHLQKAFKYLGYKKGDFPAAEKLAGEIISLPIFPELKGGEVRTICGSIKEFYKGR